jgi:hypothetical protein
MTLVRYAFFVFMCLLSVLIAAYAIGMYGFGPGGFKLPPEIRESFAIRRSAVAAHIFASAAALALGPIQFSSTVRNRWPALHRMVGRVYLCAAVPIGGLAGLYLSRFAFGGIVTRLGFGCLAVVWLFTAFQGFRSALARDFEAHRRWMIRNFSLTFAAVTLRFYLAIGFIQEVPFETTYRLVSWLCWLPNIVVGESLIRALSAKGTEGHVGQNLRQDGSPNSIEHAEMEVAGEIDPSSLGI